MDTTGYNDTQTNYNIIAFLLPSGAELALLLAISLVLLMLSNWHVIWDVLTSGAQLSQSTVNQSLQPSYDQFTQALNNNFLSQTVVFLVWGCIGSVAYMVAWGIQRTISQAKNDIDQSTYVQPKTTQDYWGSKAAHYVLALCAIFVFLVGVLGFAITIWPAASGLFGATVRSYQQLSVYRYAIEAILLVTLSLYIFRRLWQIAKYAIQTVS